MRLYTRKLLDAAFSGMGLFAVLIMACALVVILFPIFTRGAGAFVFRATIEHRKALWEQFGRGDPDRLAAERAAADAARAPLYRMLAGFEAELAEMDAAQRRKYSEPLKDLKKALRALLGPMPGEPTPALMRNRYGRTRWNKTIEALHEVLYIETWDYSSPDRVGRKVHSPRENEFEGTSLAPVFEYLRGNIEAMMRPGMTFYGGFFLDTARDANFFGGIWPEILGTIYLALGAMIFAAPIGIIAAVYFAEYAKQGRMVSLLRICVSTLAGVPSIVFGLFGLAFFINTMRVSPSKSVLAGALTLALLILPMIVRASEEAILSVPRTYKEAALSLGAGRWRAVWTVILPAALPGILTGTVISMGRAAGETAPIIFTAAVSLGPVVKLWEVLTRPTRALSWNIYNLCTEHEAVDEIRHVQYGMVLALVLIVLALNALAIALRARVSRKLRA